MKNILFICLLLSGFARASECTIKTYVWYCDEYSANPACIPPIWVSPINKVRLTDKSNEDCIGVALTKKETYRSDESAGLHFRKVVVEYTDDKAGARIRSVIR